MRFLADRTSIPVPFIIHSGTKKESPLQLSPFIIIDYIDHETKMYDALNTPGCSIEEGGILDLNIGEDKLEMLYGQLADILLRLSTPSFPHIGSLSQIDDFVWKVARRSLSMNMNGLVQLGGLPRSKLPDLHTKFNTASSYPEALADLNIEHLTHQRNDAVESADDCRRKFVAWKLFRRLAKDKRLTNPSLEKGPFKIVGVVDWEFTYAAPAERSYSPPWWLLIEKPEYWSKGIETGREYRLKTFLKVMKDCEDIAIQQGSLREEQRLSGPMGQSWENGDFWIMNAVLHSFAFDTVYWQKIDPRFFGPTENPEGAWKERLNLLDEEEKYEMEQLVARKLKEMETSALVWDPNEYTLAFREQLKRQREEVDETYII
ncbi:unnamed protein product [Penicillium egyptiacum]|uniref:Aminoglycoside phosphotransferase domain-containing protein n=1 Tax=Penicillium egyptiacum TaxID=1303716 RepID=A0A9W4K7C8_9EURO|nr:unnamed protein product [Penicillium egyptiacum]